MQSLISNTPQFVKKLWFRLALTYSVLSFLGLMLLILISISFVDRLDYTQAFTAENIERHIQKEIPTLAVFLKSQEVTQPELRAFLYSMHTRLIAMQVERKGHHPFQLSFVSELDVDLQVFDRQDQLVLRFPDSSGALRNEKKAVGRTESADTLRVHVPIQVDDKPQIGSINVVFHARFDWGFIVQKNFIWMLETWPISLVTSTLIGLFCGGVAASYITRRLQKINRVTAQWRKGNFEQQIELPNGDELSLHSLHLNDMAGELQNMLHLKQVIAISEERNRLARELHDTVKQKLFALGLQLAVVKSKSTSNQNAEENIAESVTLNREAQQDLMEIITQLRPSSLTGLTYIDQIEMLVENFVRRFEVNIMFIPEARPVLTPMVEHHLTRIAQEAISNAIRHGKANQIQVKLKEKGTQIMFLIQDNGKGFNPKRNKNGLGLISIQERSQEFSNSSISIESELGKGTTVLIQWQKEHEDG